MVEFVLILLMSYMVLLLEKQSTVNVGGEGGAFCSIDFCTERKLYAPFKYRPLGFWLARLFNITSREIKALMIWGERYYYNIYLLKSNGLEKYYVFKYFLLLFADFSFYLYIEYLGLSGIVGVLILNLFIVLTFIYDCFDYLIEIGLYSLFVFGLLSGWSWYYLGAIAVLGSLNRESSIFMIPLAYFYSNDLSFISTIIGFIIGFVIPRIMYRKPVDKYDSVYSSGFKFLVFNPIRNWRWSIWPYLKQRFTGLTSVFFLQYNKQKMTVPIDNTSITTYTKELFLNRIFLGISFIIFFFVLIIFGSNSVPELLHPMAYIFALFVLLISLPADIREIRVYCPSFLIIIPYLMFL